MPQDVRAGPDGRTLFVADMHADGVFVIDGDTFKEISFIPTGIGAHGLYPSRDGTRLYVANRGSPAVHGPRNSKDGSVSVIEFATRKVIACHWLECHSAHWAAPWMILATVEVPAESPAAACG